MSFRGYVWTVGTAACLLFWYGTYQLVFADGLVNATMLSLDYVICDMELDKKEVNKQALIGAIERDIKPSEAIKVIKSAIDEVMLHMDEAKVKAYCEGRKGY